MASVRTALVTGGGRGLGRVMALAMLEAGHRVVISSTDQTSLDEVASESGAGSHRVATVVADLSVSGEAERLAAAAAEPFGPIDILVNNAGVGVFTLAGFRPDKPIRTWDLQRPDVERFFAVNSVAPILLAARLIPPMVERGWGRIVANTTSLNSMIGRTLYGSSKAALEAETATMAAHLEGTGVTANILVPGGPTRSRLAIGSGFTDDEMYPETIMAAPMAFLASDQSNDFTARRILAQRWPDGLPPREAADKASFPIAWKGLSDDGIKFKV
ncbi:MAG: SDR family oxidoreductase [Rhodobiaceae bacterium]|nr:SDR family oxidoreductase [Rhodobiaceae bacterium]MCC0056034.1 SDR family oxidoreductase [Rhodobiaceae bacterium]